SFCCCFLMLPTSPQNRRTRFRRNNRIPRIFKHIHSVPYSDSECSSRSSLSDNNRDNRNLQTSHFKNISCNSLSLTSFFCLQPRISSRSIHQSKHRNSEFFSHFH